MADAVPLVSPRRARRAPARARGGRCRLWPGERRHVDARADEGRRRWRGTRRAGGVGCRIGSEAEAARGRTARRASAAVFEPQALRGRLADGRAHRRTHRAARRGARASR
eukprot:2522869-Prymnesium_polylepis.1